jgi:hypothetical protein
MGFIALIVCSMHPLILGRNAGLLRIGRDQSHAETVKRLQGLLPLFRHFLEKESQLAVVLIWDKNFPNPPIV